MQFLVSSTLLYGFTSLLYASSVSVVTESSPPFHYVDENGQVAGQTTEKIRQLLKLAEIKGTFFLYPWARALNLAEHDPNTLIYSIARTPQRENQFHWIAEVSAFRLSVVGLRSQFGETKSVLPAALDAYTFAVQRGDIAHYWLLEQGFREGENMLVCADIQCSWKYLIRGTVDFIIEDPSLISPTAETLGIDGKQFIAVQDIPELVTIGFLAASAGTETKIVQRLVDAAQQLGVAVSSGDVNEVQQ